MIEKDRGDRRAFLKQLSTPQLEEMIRKEIDSEGSDNQDVIFEILSILKGRDETKTVNTDTAWQEFQEHYNTPDGEGLSLYPMAKAADKKKGKKYNGLRKFIAAAAAVLVLVCAVPPALGAANIVELFAHWTNETFTFLNSDQEPPEEYEFIYSTDNPELQEIYDTVQELGVTENVVPSWIPEGFEMARDISISDLYALDKVSVLFDNADESTIKFTAKIYSNRRAMGGANYEKDDTPVEKLEIEGVTHYLMKNNDYWVCVWTVDNIECMITGNLEKTELMRIVYSVYYEEEV